MRRPISSPYKSPRMIGFKVSIDTDTATSEVLIGNQDVASISYISTGVLDITLKNPFARTPVVIASAIGTSGERANCLRGAETTKNKIRVSHGDADGTASDGDLYVIAFGYDSPRDDYLANDPFQWVTTRAGGRLLGLAVDGDTAKARGDNDFSITDNGTGDYTFTFTKPFQSEPIVVATGWANDESVAIEAATKSSVQVSVTGQSGAAVDAGVNLLVLGFDSRHEYGGLRRPIVGTQRKMRLLATQIINPAGTPSLNINSGVGTLTDKGTGNYRVTFTKAFAEPPVAVSTASETTASYSGLEATLATRHDLFVRNNGGSAVDEDVDLVLFGKDDATLY